MKPASVRHVAVMVIFAMTVMLLLTGCGAMDTLSTIKERFNNDQRQVELPVEPLPEEFFPPMEETSLTGDVVEVTLYFADGYGQSLVAESRLIPKTVGIARATINELLSGPSPESGLLPTVPYGTKLKDINVKEDGLVIVDFSSELIDNHAGGDLGETLTVYSIVNTLTQFPTVDRVQFLVEGQIVETIAGAVSLSQEIYPDSSLVMTGNYSYQ
ncbi:MAG: GerMN domain-containing protein [Clostridia bacterium]|nr:GerMN domain-containing protein [Clostridia bacterium]